MLSTVLLGLHITVCVFLIVLILINRSANSAALGAFTGGASQTLFGSQGSSSFITKLTRVLGGMFFATCLSLSLIHSGYQKNHVDAIIKAAESKSEVTPSKN
jgi:preprotein translocase subunit SecG